MAHRRGWPLVAVVSLVLAIPLTPAAAQDAHYWSQQYGSREALLGGAVIGSVDGLPSVYYNPARLGQGDRGSFALSTHVFGWETITVEDGVSPGTDLSSTRTGLEPSLIAGKLPWGGENQHWAYSILTRRSVDSDIGTSFIFEDPSDLLSRVVGGVRLENQIRDYWGGITWSRALGSGLSVGVSGFAAAFTADRRSEVIVEGLDTTGSGLAIIDHRGYEFWHTRVLAKLGAWYRIASIDLGLTVTTPSLGLVGSGSTSGNAGVFGSETEDELEAAFYDDLDIDYRSPLSVGFGLAWAFGGTRLHASCEWFDALGPYVVADSPPLQTNNGPAPTNAVHEAAAVLNWGVGIEHRISPSFEGFASFVTDDTFATGDLANVGTAQWDIDVVTAGFRMDTARASITLGAGLAFGDTPLDEVVDFTELEGGPTDTGAQQSTIRYRNWRVIFGFEF